MATKHIHQMKWRDIPTGVTVAACGRRVSWHRTSDDVQRVSCPKCRTISASQAVVDYALTGES